MSLKPMIKQTNTRIERVEDMPGYSERKKCDIQWDKLDYSKIKENYETGLKTIIWSELRQIGFKKKGPHLFYRLVGEFIQYIWFDRSPTIPINLGVELYIHINGIPLLFRDNLIFPESLSQKNGHLTFHLIPPEFSKKGYRCYTWELSEDKIKTELVFNEILSNLQTLGIKWLTEISDYNTIIKAYELGKEQFFLNFQVGRWADLIGAISYERIGNKKQALNIYQNMSKEDLHYLGNGIREFVKTKIKELQN